MNEADIKDEQKNNKTELSEAVMTARIEEFLERC